ncbi:aprataxin-like protein [Neocucurbitaria cava]|uniref:Aprataxin-like protein n=1 Tax=Neocucurbitaria cava TaxID=798079 RepID=A0A9W8Y029_9PLEO|nr:aprataxin-like protein [Neocucurbitaria cava]
MASTSSNSSPPQAQTHDAITAEEITGEETPNSLQKTTDPSSQKRPNAFTELMSSTKKPKPTTQQPPGVLDKAKSVVRGFDPRNGLSIYIEKPEANPEGRVVEYDDDFVVINDKYPKASVHLLLLPRKPEYYTQHPLSLLSTNPHFLSELHKRVARLKQLAASELRRQYGHLSASDAPYQQALEALMSSADLPPPTPEECAARLPPGRDWLADIVAGVHTHPSMNHLHVHVFSRDMQSPWMKHKKHYLSFNSTFLVRLEEFPLEEGSERFHPGDWPGWDMKCWRCGQNFKNKFAALKAHLEEEFEEWKKE